MGGIHVIQHDEQPTERLAAVDEANLTLDHRGQVNVFLIAGLLGEGGFVRSDGGIDMARLRSTLVGRLQALPQLRRIAIPTGRRHEWAEISPDLEHHVRLAPAVDGIRGLEQLCADLMSRPLPMDRPLWELLVVPGASSGGMGMVLRIHHATADGIAAVALARELFAEDPPPSPTPEPVDGRAQEVSHRRLLRSAHRLRVGLHRTIVTLSNHDVGPTALLGIRSAAHGVEFLDVDLAALESHVRPAGATVNDALLCTVAAGYRAVLRKVGESALHWLPVSVPVALERRGTSANQVGVMLVRLPLADSDPRHRLGLIAEQTRREKPEAREQGTLELMRGPIGARILDRVGRRQRLVAGFVTNVPGPSGLLRLCGAPVTAIWPVAVLAANVRSGVAAVSYGGRLWCAIHFDAANIPGSVFAEAMTDEFGRLTT
jgi:diacylglycerol O-acyltransferase